MALEYAFLLRSSAWYDDRGGRRRRPSATKRNLVKRRFWPAMGLLAAIMLAVYLANPFGTASSTRARGSSAWRCTKIPSRSMEPTLQQGDFILANAARYAFAEPQVGDLVVPLPAAAQHRLCEAHRRIPGDRVRIDGSRLYVNDHQVTSPTWRSRRCASRIPAWPSGPSPPATAPCSATTATTPTTAATGGYVPRADLVGRVFVVWYAEDTRRIGSVR